jgi:hypothetical protein
MTNSSDIMTRNCLTCGKQFKLTRTYYIDKKPVLHCSYACSNKRSTINQSYFTPPLTPDKLITLGQFTATAFIQNDHTIFVRSDLQTITDIQTKINSNYPVIKSDQNKLKLKISSSQMVSDLSNYGIVHNPMFQEYIPYDIFQGLLQTDCYKTKDGVQTFRTPSSKLALEVCYRVGGEIITETYKDVPKGVLGCYWVVMW